MRLLLTNDDGIGSPGIQLLAAGLREAGHRVFVMAPTGNRSAISHGITFHNGPLRIAEIDTDTWACEGTPVDCVVAAFQGGVPDIATAEHPLDAVISGINRGANLGTDIIFSGTAAAARQGAMWNMPSLALSLAEGLVWHWNMAVIFAVERLEEMLSYWKPDSFVNVNIPNQQELPSSLVHAFPSVKYYNDRMDVFHAPDGCRYFFAKPWGDSIFVGTSSKPEQGSDWSVVADSNASISEIFIHPVLLESVKGRGDI